MKCDQCEMVSINGVACHETGCPNAHSRWDADHDEWVKQRECRECGSVVDADARCCEPDEEDFNARWQPEVDPLDQGDNLGESPDY
jgi:hypothetical protein